MGITLGTDAPLTMKYIASIGDQEFEVDIINQHEVAVNGKHYKINFKPVSGQPVFSLLADNGSYQAHLFESDDDELQILLRGTLYKVLIEDEREKRLRAAAGSTGSSSGELILKSPMPGLIVQVPVKVGDLVSTGDVLVILESMKMQNELKSSQDGKVTQIQVKEGDSVEQKQILLIVEASKD